MILKKIHNEVYLEYSEKYKNLKHRLYLLRESNMLVRKARGETMSSPGSCEHFEKEKGHPNQGTKVFFKIKKKCFYVLLH